MEELKYVTYEDFGAVGDGETDDTAAIVAAHAFANIHKLPVKTRRDATYYIGGSANPAIIETDTDWNTSRFTIDDRCAEDYTVPCFIVRSALKSESISLTSLRRDQKQTDCRPANDCFVTVRNRNVLRYRRYGLNVDNGTPSVDSFVLHKDGSIYGPVDWDYDEITDIDVQPVDSEPLTVRGGVFTTIANRGESVYQYYKRSIEISRSNVTVDGIIHYVCGEISHGSPYRGFISAEKCAFITVQNCFSTGHKIYMTIGRAGLPVPMGSYDLHANSVVDITFRNCRVNNINDSTRWGVIASNFCKNLLVDNCVFSRLDAHMGVSGTYTVRDSSLGWQGLNAIGRGSLLVENTHLYGRCLICFREDYGSTWEGDVTIRNCVWTPPEACSQALTLFFIRNNRMHDFGYPCFMPENISIEGLTVESSSGIAYLFSDPDTDGNVPQPEVKEPRPCRFTPVRHIALRKLSFTGGAKLLISPNPAPFAETRITE